MDIKTGLSIYNKPWLIEPSAALQMLDFFEKVKEGEKWDYGHAKGEENGLSVYKIYQKFFASEGVIMSPESSWDMSDFKGFDGARIAVIPVSGPLMKNDFCGSFGTESLRQLTRMASGTNSVKAILYLNDSPGGTVDGTQAFADDIKASSKRTISLVSGMMCSANMWTGGSADEVYASCETDLVGSIGTMCGFYDNSKAMEVKGVVLREYYATASTDKNRAYKEAQDGDGKKLIQEMLDPMNNVFLGAMKKNRPRIKEDALTGKVYTSNAAMEMGLIDGIKTFEQIIGGDIKPKTTTTSTSFYQGNKAKKMTAAEIKTAHPESYNTIIAEGATQERERIEGWLTWQSVDADAVAKGIESGKTVTQKVANEFAFKMHSKALGKQAEAENAPEVETGAVAKPKTAEVAKEDEYFDALEKQLATK